jgi:hypothetical protein
MARHNFVQRVSLSDSSEDFLILSMDFESDDNNQHGELISFSLMQIIERGKFVKEILRYDCAHGALHLHKLYAKKIVIEEINKDISMESFLELEKDIKENWFKYKKWFLQNKGL